jgi:hypothetical protein
MQSFEHSAVTPAAAGIAKSAALVQATNTILRSEPLPEPRITKLSTFEMHRLREQLSKLRGEHATVWSRNLTGTTAERAVHVLRRASTYRGRTGFSDTRTFREMVARVDALLENGGPIVLALPLGGGKAPNAAKTGQNYLPDASEWTAWTMLAALADALVMTTGRAVHVMTVPDAGLHTADLGFPGVEYAAHVRQAATDLEWLGIKNVTVPDTLAHLPLGWSEEVAARAVAAVAKLVVDEPARVAFESQLAALLFIRNLRVAGWDLPRQVLVTAALGGREIGAPSEVARDAELVRSTTRLHTPHYIGVNHALRTLEVPQRMAKALHASDAMLRLTVHAKPGEARPNLVPDGQLSRPGLLPMQGVGVIDRSQPSWQFGTEFELEAVIAGQRKLVTPDGRFVAFEGDNTATATPAMNLAA